MWQWMTEDCTPVTSTISTATSTRQTECCSMLLNHVCVTSPLSASSPSFTSSNMTQFAFFHCCHKGRKEQRYWDGQKAVFVVLLGSTVVLPCVKRRNVWTDWSNEEEDQQVCVYCISSVQIELYVMSWLKINLFGGSQVVHWDRQSPGVRHDRADRLVDLYASGEQRSYGPLFLQRKMNISKQAFSEGDFSLSISDLQVCNRRMGKRHRDLML